MLPAFYLLAVALLLIYGILFNDAGVGVLFGTGAAIATSISFIIATLIGIYFVRFLDVALVSIALSIVVTVISIPGRTEMRKLLGLREYGFEQYLLLVISTFIAFLFVLSLIRLLHCAVKAGKNED